jgi:hypothetical protein
MMKTGLIIGTHLDVELENCPGNRSILHNSDVHTNVCYVEASQSNG